MSEVVYDAVSQSGFVLRLFGGMEVNIDGKPATLRTKKAKWLLALLTLRTGWVDREWLAAILWPDSDEAASRYNLRRALSDLKADLGTKKDRLQAGPARTLRLDLEGAYCDVGLFDRSALKLDTASLETAVSLYQGGLLEDCQEEWVHPERSQREQQYLKVLELLADRYLEAGQGESDTAHNLCEQAILLCRVHNLRVNMVYLLLMQANILVEKAEYAKAYACCAEAMRVGQELGQERAEYEGVHTRGQIYFSQQEYVQAQLCFQRALDLYQEIGSRGGEAAARHCMGRVAQKLGDRMQALLYCRQALRLNVGIGVTIQAVPWG